MAMEDKIRMLKAGTSRVRDSDGFVGTVMYVGPVASAKDQNEVYAGIAWDDQNRGKHDGSVICRRTNQLVRHFSCAGGSFLRLSKLDLGTTLDGELLRQRYVDQDAPVIAPNNVLPHAAMTSGGREKPIELLGELKIRARQQLSDLEKISLRSMGIARVDPSSLREFRHLREMDLAGNLLGEWDTVLQILKQFPLLENISLASNRIQDIPNHCLADDVDLSRIRILNLNDCSIRSFSTVRWISKVAPNLEELCVAYSDFSSIDTPESGDDFSGFEHLRLLDCSSCGLTSWNEQVRPLFGSLPRLQQLVLNGNALSHIPTENESSRGFESLASLHLAGTAITAWTDLDGLNSLAALRSLRFRNTPLSSTMGAAEARAITIARLPNIDYLNASQVSSQERLEAERRYVSNIARDLLVISVSGENEDAQKEKLLDAHPVFAALMEKHKDSMVTATHASNGSGNMAQMVLNVTIRSMAASSCNTEPLRKRLPGGLTVGRLKLMCSRAFGLDIDLQILHFRTDSDPFPIELDNDENTLAYYGVCDGSEILMNEVDLEAKARDTARAEEERDRRIEQQENDARTLQELQRSEVKARSLAAEKAAGG